MLNTEKNLYEKIKKLEKENKILKDKIRQLAAEKFSKVQSGFKENKNNDNSTLFMKF